MPRLICLLGILPQFLFAQLQQIGHLPYAPLALAGCWHQVDKNGTEYALVGTSAGLSIVDLSDPTQPVQRFTVPGPINGWREMKTWNGFAYVGTEGDLGGITIVDLNQLPDTVHWKVWYGPGTDTLIRKSHTVACAAGHLFIFGGTQNGALICDISDPWNPVVKSKIADPYIHDGYIQGDTLWASQIYAGQFSAYDISDITNPKFLVSQTTPFRFNHNTWLSDNERTIFTTDEKLRSPLASYDISDFENITQLDLYYPSQKPRFEVHNVRVLSDYLVNPSYGGQLTIVDAHRPDNLIETAWADLGTSLVWDADPYLPSGLIIATAKSEGFFVFQPSYERACYLEGRVTDADTGLPLSKVKVVVTNTNNADLTRADGRFKTGAGQPGTYTLQLGKVGYRPLTVSNIAVKRGEVTTLELKLDRY